MDLDPASIFRSTLKFSLNENIDALQKAAEVRTQAEQEENALRQQIASSQVERVIVFIDMVGSTLFKQEHSSDPSVWISRVYRFSGVVKSYVEYCNGVVVKYIGDEVMAVFEKPTQISDAMNFVQRIDELQKFLTITTGFETEVKIAIDVGPVALLAFDGHNELDPQGAAVDRCARVAKYAHAGTVVTTVAFVDACSKIVKLLWKSVGVVDLKGLGVTEIFQLGRQTISVVPTQMIAVSDLELMTDELKRAKSELEKANTEITSAKVKNAFLQDQLSSLKATPIEVGVIDTSDADSKEDEDEQERWEEIEQLMSDLKKKLSEAMASDTDLARFLFLHARKSNYFPSKDESLDLDRMVECDYIDYYGDYEEYYLKTSNRYINRLVGLVDRIEDKLKEYSEDFPEQDDKDYDLSLTQPQFWMKELGLYVLK